MLGRDTLPNQTGSSIDPSYLTSQASHHPDILPAGIWSTGLTFEILSVANEMARREDLYLLKYHLPPPILQSENQSNLSKHNRVFVCAHQIA